MLWLGGDLEDLNQMLLAGEAKGRDYQRLKAGRAYFGDFDPFGDFDLIFGASKMNLKSVDLPIRYQARTYGETQISRFRHGLLLFRMVHYAFKKLKAF